MRKNCPSDREKLEAEGREFAKFFRSLGQFIQTVKDQEQFFVTECFFNLLMEFVISNELEQLDFVLEKNIGI